MARQCLLQSFLKAYCLNAKTHEIIAWRRKKTAETAMQLNIRLLIFTCCLCLVFGMHARVE